MSQKKGKLVGQNRGPLVELLADIIRCFSYDLVKLIAGYYDISQQFESMRYNPYVFVRPCTMCLSVDSKHVHFAGKSWKAEKNPTASLLTCSCCQKEERYKDVYNGYFFVQLNLIIRSKKTLTINSEGFVSGPVVKPDITLNAICDKCLLKTGLLRRWSTCFIMATCQLCIIT